jgi:NitT/TauT family transport system substrate-binding protein
MRRAFVWLGLAMMGLVALPAAPAAAADLEKVRVSIIPIGDVAPLFAAIQNGYFREVGLEIDTTPSAGGAAGIPGLVGGSFDVAYGNVVSALLAAQQGLDVKVIAAGTNVTDPKLDATGIFAKSDAGIKSGKDLEGKSIAVNTRNNVIWLYARAWVKATGGDPERVTFKEVPFPQMEDALRQQRVDAAFMVPPFSIVAAQKGGLAKVGMPYSDVQPGVDVGQYVTTGKLLATKPETVKKFVAALRKGIEWYNANLTNEALLTLISGYTRADVALLKLAPVPTAPIRTNMSQVKKTMELMIESKLLPAPLDLDKIVDPLAR